MSQSRLFIKELAPFTVKQPDWKIQANISQEMHAIFANYTDESGEEVYVSGYLSPGQYINAVNIDAAKPANVCITRKWMYKNGVAVKSHSDISAPLYLETLGSLLERCGPKTEPFWYGQQRFPANDDDFRPNDPAAVFALKMSRVLIDKMIDMDIYSGEFYLHNDQWHITSIGANLDTINFDSLDEMIKGLEIQKGTSMSLQVSVMGETLVFVANGRAGKYRWPSFLL